MNHKSKINRKIHKNNKTLKHNTTYGEMEEEGIHKLYRHLLKNFSFNCFMDLGSGKGKVCCYMATQSDITHVLGVELVKERHNEALKLKENLSKENNKKITFLLNDIFNISLKKYKTMDTFIWISSLCFPQNVVNNIFKKIQKELKPGTIVCCSKTPTNNIGKLMETLVVPQTWNKHHVVSIYKI